MRRLQQTRKQSNDPDYEAKKNRVLERYDLADAKTTPGPGDPTVVICMDEFGLLNLQPHPGKQWALVTAARATRRHQLRRLAGARRASVGTEAGRHLPLLRVAACRGPYRPA